MVKEFLRIFSKGMEQRKHSPCIR